MSYWDAGKRFVPKREGRGTGDYEFFELSLAQGPAAIGVTGQNRLIDFIGTAWLLLLDLDMQLHLFRQGAVGEWEEVTTLLPPVFDAPLPAGARRVSFAFDQAARINVAYELAESVYLTRWNPSTNTYVQNVTVSGVDPVVAFDATWGYDVASSDVLLFYLDAATRSKLMVRVQRDVYAVEYEMHDYGAAAVLDRIVRMPWKYQVLASDAAGEPFESAGERLALRSLLYPVKVGDQLSFAPSAPGGSYVFSMFTDEPVDALGFTVQLGNGAYEIVVINESLNDSLGFDALLDDGSYVLVVRDYVPTESLGFDGELATGEYVFSMFSVNADDGLGFAASFTGGSYELG